MNILLTDFPNGFRFEADDIRFEQQAIRDAFKGIFSLYAEFANQRGFIISGCKRYTNANLEPRLSEGYIFLDNEVLYFPDQPFAIVVSGNTQVFDLNVTYNSDGDESDGEGNNIQCYQVRNAIRKSYPDANVPAGSFDYDGLRLEQILKQIAAPEQADPISHHKYYQNGSLQILNDELEVGEFKFPDYSQKGLTASMSLRIKNNNNSSTNITMSIIKRVDDDDDIPLIARTLNIEASSKHEPISVEVNLDDDVSANDTIYAKLESDIPESKQIENVLFKVK